MAMMRDHKVHVIIGVDVDDDAYGHKCEHSVLI